MYDYSPILHTTDEAVVASPMVRLLVDCERKRNYLDKTLLKLGHGRGARDFEQISMAYNKLSSLSDELRARLWNEQNDVPESVLIRVQLKHIISPYGKQGLRMDVEQFGKTNKELHDNLGIPEFTRRKKPPLQYVEDDKGKKVIKFRNLQERQLYNMHQMQMLMRQSLLKQRLVDELRLAHQRGKFVVFNTLTVREQDYMKVFEKGSPCFKNFIRKITRSCGRAEGLSKAEADNDKDLHRYFAVVEEGGKTGRLHIHVIHIMRTLPEGSTDPNLYARTIGKQPIYQELQSMKSLWEYGDNVMPKIVRYAHNDAFGNAGYLWPLETRRGSGDQMNKEHTKALTQVQVHGTMAGIVKYIGKYVCKSYTEKDPCNNQPNKTTPKRWRPQSMDINQFRTRMTRGFGEEWMRTQLTCSLAFPTATLEEAVLERHRKITQFGNSAPTWRRLRKNIIRELSQRKVFQKHFLTRKPLPNIFVRGKLVMPTLSDTPAYQPVSFTRQRILAIGAAISDIYTTMDIPPDYAGYALPSRST